MASLVRKFFWSGLLMVSVIGCTSRLPQRGYETPSALRSELVGDLRTLSAVRPYLMEFDEELAELRAQGGWIERSYFSAIENDRMEHLLFRFVTSHSALWKITTAYQGMRIGFDDSMLEAKVHVLSSHASLLLASHSAFLVAEFANAPVSIATMNEAFYRSEIPRDRYYELARGITSSRLSRLRRAGALEARELADPTSELARLANSDSRYRALVELNTTLQTIAANRLQAALDAQNSRDPEAIRKSGASIEGGLYVARSLLSSGTSAGLKI